jgi:uncharacterized protein (TIGR02265 family)
VLNVSITIAVSAIEGLFVKSLKPTGAFREALKQKGLDLDSLQHEYPLEVWTDCVDLSAHELYPTLPLPLAWERLGRHFIEGYFQTLSGRMISTMLPFLSGRAFVNQVPRFMSTGKRGMPASVEWSDTKHAIVTMRGSHPRVAALMAGVLAVSFERMHLSPVSLVPVELGGLDAELRVGLP